MKMESITGVFFGLLGVMFMISLIILPLLSRKIKGCPKGLGLLFCEDKFLTKNGIVFRFYLRQSFIVLIMINIINFILMGFFYD
ncbi:hypothetical protein AB2S62_16515 [Vibrio sp. NTOU-M3]|uniref:hypothetical protein n=1 Tax=Vibrio sp. NTOU-M3 TaxID=3234954 RepID=UPI00349F7F0F